MQKDNVAKMLGPPDAEFISYDLRKGKENFVDSSWAYYLHLQKKGLVNENSDRYVFLYFDTNENIYWALPTNIESLTQLGDRFQIRKTQR